MIVEIPDFAAFQELMQTEAAAEAMKGRRGPRRDTRDSRQGIAT
jgi:hypothetical protein